MTTSPKITVVVPTYSRSDRLSGLIEALANQTGVQHYEVIIVDNGSTDDTPAILGELCDKHGFRMLRIDVNRGPAAARNLGWREASSDLIAFTDDDCLPSPIWLQQLLLAFDEGADLVQGRTVADDDAFDARGPFSHFIQVLEPSPYYQTCNMAYRHDLLERLDGFVEDMSGGGFGDDTDLGWRAVESGARAVFESHAVVQHEVTDSDPRAWLRARYRRGPMAHVVKLHPTLREHQRNRWTLPPHARAVMAGIGLALVAAKPRAPAAWAVGALTAKRYARARRPMTSVAGGRTQKAKVLAITLSGDLAEVAVMARSSIRSRSPLL